MKRKTVYVLMAAVLILTNSASVFAQGGPDRFAGRELPESVASLKLDEPLFVDSLSGNVLDGSLVGVAGANRVIIRLSADSGSVAFSKGVDTVKAVKAAKAQQADFLKSVLALDSSARVIAQVQTVLNAVFVEVDASLLSTLAQDSRVVRIAPVGNYEIDLSETVPYIGASAVQAAGFDGSGIKVAVLDSGIDYTHYNLGGSGNVADFNSNNPTVVEAGTFPTWKVVGGYDFVGEAWTGGTGSPPEAPDPDPLDKGPGAGHGSHVADIIAGKSTDGLHKGVAPGASLYAVGVCSKITTSCSGIALIQGMDFAADPNGDGTYSDRVDIINMSLGSSYGQPFDDDLSLAVDNATALGILTVASAGNSADKPYANGTPAAAKTALSVAQTQVPSATLQQITVNGVNYPGVFQPWSAPLVSAIGPAPVVWGGNFGSALGCSVGGDVNGTAPGTEPYPAGSLSGMIVLVNRGDCNFSIKIYNIQRGGGVAGIIGLVDTSAPFAGSFGAGGPFTIPGYMISQSAANSIRTAITGGATGIIDPANQLSLIGQMVGSSSRGPQHESTTLIKPEIGAPGASVSAIYGTGNGVGPFGGTSGAAPMVSGSAALLLQGFGGTYATDKGAASGNAFGNGLKPVEVKALLMNNGETNILTDPFTGLAPITRIGGGEVRVDRALTAPIAAWDKDVPSGALSFGFVDVADSIVSITKTVKIRNLDNKKHTYTVTPTFRFNNDATNGAVTLSAPSTVVVKPGQGNFTYFNVTLTIDGAKLRGNSMNSGSQGANPAALTLNEYDGYLILNDGSHPVHLAWHVLPRKDARVVPDTTEIVPGSFPQEIGLNNTGIGTAQNDAYALLAVSDNLPEGGLGAQSPTPDIRAVGINTIPVPARFCSANPSFLWLFAVNTWETQQHLLPVSHQIYLDTNQDGADDYVVLNRDASGLGTITDGRQLAWVVNLATGTASAFFYAEHSTNTGNTVLYICGEQIGMNASALLTRKVNMAVVAQDFYYGGPGDVVEGLTVTPLGEQHFGVANDVSGNTYDAGGLSIYDFGAFPGNTPELGLMLVTNGDRGTDNRGGATQDTEALLFMVP